MGKTILVDVDDTIENLLEAWVKHLNNKYNLTVDVNDCYDWDMHKLFPTLTQEQIHGVLADEELWDMVEPKEDAIFYLKQLQSEGYEIFLVTSTYYKSVRIKVEYLQRYFPFIDLAHIIICQRKQMVRGDILVDDYIKNLEGGEYQGILYSALHNRNVLLGDSGLMRAKDWSEVYNLIHLMI